MKVASAKAIAELARQRVPEEVAAAYGGSVGSFGPEYIIPTPFDPRLIETVPSAVAQAATDSGVARPPLTDVATYRQALRERLNPTTAVLASTHALARSRPTRTIFAAAEEDTVLRAAIAFPEVGSGTPIPVTHHDGVP